MPIAYETVGSGKRRTPFSGLLIVSDGRQPIRCAFRFTGVDPPFSNDKCSVPPDYDLDGEGNFTEYPPEDICSLASGGGEIINPTTINCNRSDSEEGGSGTDIDPSPPVASGSPDSDPDANPPCGGEAGGNFDCGPDSDEGGGDQGEYAPSCDTSTGNAFYKLCKVSKREFWINCNATGEECECDTGVSSCSDPDPDPCCTDLSPLVGVSYGCCADTAPNEFCGGKTKFKLCCTGITYSCARWEYENCSAYTVCKQTVPTNQAVCSCAACGSDPIDKVTVTLDFVRSQWCIEHPSLCVEALPCSNFSGSFILNKGIIFPPRHYNPNCVFQYEKVISPECTMRLEANLFPGHNTEGMVSGVGGRVWVGFCTPGFIEMVYSFRYINERCSGTAETLDFIMDFGASLPYVERPFACDQAAPVSITLG